MADNDLDFTNEAEEVTSFDELGVTEAPAVPGTDLDFSGEAEDFSGEAEPVEAPARPKRNITLEPPADARFPISADGPPRVIPKHDIGPKPEPGMPGATTFTFDGRDAVASTPEKEAELNALPAGPQAEPWKPPTGEASQIDAGEFTNAFMRSVGPQNINLSAQTMLAYQDMTGDTTFEKSANEMIATSKNWDKKIKKPKVPTLRDIDIMAEGRMARLSDWFKQATGNATGSTVIPLAGGFAGSMLGKRVGGKPGGKLGALGGAFFGSNALNIGSMRETLIEEGVTDPKLRGKVSLMGGMVMSGLDSLLPGDIAEQFTGAARKELQKSIARRFIRGAVKGSLKEGLTEGAQDTIEKVFGKVTGGNKIDPWELIESFVENAAQGAAGGGVMGGAGDVLSGAGGAVPAAPAPVQQPAPGKGNRQRTSDILKMLGDAGITADDIRAMSPEQYAQIIKDLQEQGAVPEGAAPAQPQPPVAPPPGQAPLAPPRQKPASGAPTSREMETADEPSAEPIADIKAQIEDMKDPNTERRGVFLSKDAWAHAGPAIKGRKDALKIENFDGKGGVLLVPNQKAGEDALKYRDRGGTSMQEIIGYVTGAGRGKPSGGTIVVQQKDEQGNVTRESLVTEAQLEKTVKAFESPGKTVETIKPEEAIARREKGVEGDNLDFSGESEPGIQGEGTRAKPIKVQDATDLNVASAGAATDYTPEQGEANNRELGHVEWKGLKGSIEVAAGGTRKGTDPKTGKAWETEHTVPYGYWKGTKGADDMHIDAYWGPKPEAKQYPVYVLDELDDKTGKFRQHKTFVGFPSEQAARQAYLGTSSKKPEMVGAVTAMSVDEFKDWLSKPQTKPVGKDAPFDAKKWQGDRDERIKKSKAEGNTHLDQVGASVESMRGKEIYNVHDPKERGTVRTVANTGDVVVNWADEYSGDKNLATVETEKVKGKPVEIRQTWLAPSDLKDYVFAKSSTSKPAETKAEKPPVEEISKPAEKSSDPNIDETVRPSRNDAEKKMGKFRAFVKQITPFNSVSGYGNTVAEALENAHAKLGRIETKRTKIEKPEAVAPNGSTDRLKEFDGPIDGYDREDEGNSGPRKKEFLDDGRSYLRKVMAELQKRGFEPYKDKKGKGISPVSINEGGPAVSGDIMLNMTNPDLGTGIYVTISNGGGMGPGTSIMTRTQDASAPYGKSGVNEWLDSKTTVDKMADHLEKIAKAVKKEQNDLLEEFENALPKNEDGEPDVIGAGGRVMQKVVGKPGFNWNDLIDIQKRKAIALAKEETYTPKKPAINESVKAETPAEKPKKQTAAEKREAENARRREAEYAVTKKRIDKLPSDIGEIEALYRKELEAYHNAWINEDRAAADAARERLDDLELRANDGEEFGIAASGSPTEDMLERVRAPNGQVPMWGQRGRYIAELKGVRAIVELEGYSSVHAVDLNKPFPSSTGYHSVGGGHPKLGQTVEDYALGLIQASIDYSPDKKKRPLVYPERAYRLPEGKGEPESIERGKIIKEGKDYPLYDKAKAMVAKIKAMDDWKKRAKAWPQGEHGNEYIVAIEDGKLVPKSDFPTSGSYYIISNNFKDRFVEDGANPEGDPNRELELDEDEEIEGIEEEAPTSEKPSINRPEKGSEEAAKFEAAVIDLLDADEIQGNSIYLVIKGQPIDRLDVLQKLAEQESDYERLSMIRNIAEKLKDELVPTVYGRGKGKKAEADLAQRQGIAQAERAKFNPLINLIDSKRADMVAAAMKNKGLKNGQTVYYTAETYDGRTGETIVGPLKGVLVYRDGDTSAQLHQKGGILFLTPRDFREYVTLEKPPKKAQIEGEDESDADSESLRGSSQDVSGEEQPGDAAPTGADAEPAGVSGTNRAGSARNARQPGQPDADGENAADQPGGENAGASSDSADRGRTRSKRPDLSTSPTTDRLEQERADRRRRNYRIAPDDHVGEGAAREKITGNIEAIRTLKAIEDQNALATDEQKKKLVKYVGWGAFAQDVFAEHKPEWAKERQALKELMTKEELDAARRSTLNAHYTSPDVISGMWKALAHLGYRGGRALEPSAGVGHFIGLQPSSMAGATDWSAVELDSLTGRILQQLYAGSDVTVAGFETFERPKGFYDLAISNVPFGDFKLHDKKYPSFSIHDYFFVKSLDLVRQGGVVAFITSSFTMDKVRDRARTEINKKADFLGAIRLPGGRKGAFAGNAGTEVTTDIIFLRKRAAGEQASPLAKPWNDLKQIVTPEGPANINEYFVDNQDMLLGEMRLVGTMYATKSPALIGDATGIEQKIEEAAKKFLPEDALLPRSTRLANLKGEKVEAETSVLDPDQKAAVKEGAFFLKDGKLFKRVHGMGQEALIPTGDQDRVRALIGLRDIVNKLLTNQTQGGNETLNESLRHDLGTVYGKFVKKFGPINLTKTTVTTRKTKSGDFVTIRKMPNFNAFRTDPDAYKVSAIEIYDEDKGTADKAAIFNANVIGIQVAPTVNSPADAIAVSLNEVGHVDINVIANLLDMHPKEVPAALGDLVFLNPDGDQYQSREQYLAGDVVKKLHDAKQAAKSDRAFDKNVKALIDVQPKPLTRDEIRAPMGAAWVPVDIVEKFIAAELESTIKISLNDYTKHWGKASGWFDQAAQVKYGTNMVNVEKVMLAALNQTPLRVTSDVRNPDGSTTTVVNEDATREVQVKIKLLRDAWTGWVWADDNRAIELENLYNNMFNRLAPQNFDGSHLTLPGLAQTIRSAAGDIVPFVLRRHQKNAIWRIIQNGNALLAHVVGAGKTFTMIAAGMEEKRLGLIKRPVYVVPNHMLEQFSREFLQAYPGANILVAQKDEMSKDNRRAFVAKVAAQDWDGVIITHDAHGRISMSQEAYEEFYGEQIQEIEDATEHARQEEGKKSLTMKELEKLRVRWENKLKALTDETRKDQGITYEEMGIDRIYLDEAHLFKNLSFFTRHTRVKGMGQGDAQRATDMFIKIRSMEKRKPGRSAVFATGTPISNTMAEMFTMQRYLQLDTLKEYKVDKFDAWASTFGEIVTQMELSPDGRTFRENTSFSKFTNIPELVAIYSIVADTQTADMLNLPRPKRKNGKITLVEANPSDLEEEIITKLVARAAEVRGKKAEKGGDNMLKIVSEGRKVATDARLLNPNNPFNPEGKTALLVSNVHRIWKEGKHPGLAQLIFLDMGVPTAPQKAKKPGAIEGPDTIDIVVDADGMEIEDANLLTSKFNLYEDIRQRLMQRGIPKDQIAFIHEATDDAKKALMFQRVRSGKIRVLLGSTGKMGVGTNVQRLLVAMHHMDAPWKPAEVEQRDGRIERQGNLNDEIEMLRYITKRSFDSFMWQALERKAKFIAQIQAGARGVREAEDIDTPLPEAAELKAAASGDPRIMEHAELSKTVRDLEMAEQSHLRTISTAKRESKFAETDVANFTETIAKIEKDIELVTDLSGDNFKAELAIDPKGEVTKRKDMGEAIRDFIVGQGDKQTARHANQRFKLGTMSGLAMEVDVTYQGSGDLQEISYTPIIKGESEYSARDRHVYIFKETDGQGVAQKFQNLVGNIPSVLEYYKDRLEQAKKTIIKLKPQIEGKPFADAEKLATSQKRLKELTDDLTEKKTQAPPPEAKPSPSVDTEAFKRWFGNSKMVDAEGKPLVVYHGTRSNFEAFGEDKAFFFTSDKELASVYSMRYGGKRTEAMRAYDDKFDELRAKLKTRGLTEWDLASQPEWRAMEADSRIQDSAVLPVYLKIEKPYIVDAQTAAPSILKGKDDPEWVADLKASGYDGLIFKNINDVPMAYTREDRSIGERSSDIYIPFGSTQIKSATGNSGAFNPADPKVNAAAIEWAQQTTRSLPPEQMRKATEAIQTIARNILGHNIRVEAGPVNLKNPTFHGVYEASDRSIFVALNMAHDPINVIGHEAVHAMRDIGVITKPEWAAMARWAQRQPTPQGMREWYRNYYSDNSTATPEQVEDKVLEEVIAAAFGDFFAGKPFVDDEGGHVARIMRKVADFIEALRNWMDGAGFKTVEGLFNRMATGEMARRTPDPNAIPPQIYTRPNPAIRMPRSRPNIPRTFMEPEDDYRVILQSNLPILTKMAQSTAAVTLGVRRDLQDTMVDMARIEAAATASTGQPLNNALRVYQTETLYAGRAGERIEDLRLDVIEPIAQEMRRLGLTMAQLDDFLYARHAPERNAYIASINPQFPDGGSGMTDAEAQQVMIDLTQAGKLQAAQQVAARIDRMRVTTLNTLLRGQVIDQYEYNSLLNFYKHYVPLRGDPNDDGSGSVASGRKYDTRAKVTQQALGRRSRADSPTAYSIAQAQQAIILAEKARVGRSLLRLARRFPNRNLWQVDQIVTRRYLNPVTGMVQTMPDNLLKVKAENVIAVREGGNLYWITIHHKGLARGMKGTDTGSMHVAIRLIINLQRAYALMRTGYDPQFFIPNFLRDAQAAGLHITADQGKGIMAATMKSIPSAMRGIFQSERKHNTTNPWAQIYKEFALAGGKVGVFGMEDIEVIKTRLDRTMKLMGHGPIITPYKAIRAASDYMLSINSAVENAVRVSLYKAMRDARDAQGNPLYSQDEAAFAAKEVTVNFNRKGHISKWIGAFYVFFNAGIQGPARTAKALYRSKLVRSAVIGLFLSGFVMDMVNSMLSGDSDDDGEDDYDQIPEWVRERNFIFVKPGAEKGGYFHIPQAFTYNVFHYAGTTLGRFVRGKITATEAAANVAGALLEAGNPLKSFDWATTLAPTLLDPWVEHKSNQDWKGDPIYPEDRPGATPTPDSQKAFQSVNPIFKSIAEKLNSYTGGDEIRPGIIDVSPESLEYIGDFLGGGAVNTFNQIMSTAGKVWREEPLDWERVPFTRKLYGTISSTQGRTEYYTMRDAVNITVDQFEKALQEGDEATVKHIMNNYAGDLGVITVDKTEPGKPIKVRSAFDEADKLLTQLRKQRNAVKLDAERQVIQEAMDKVMAQMRKAYRKVQNK